MAEILVEYASPLELTTRSGLSTLPGGHTTVAGERILTYSAAADPNVGIWVVVSGGAWTRATDFDESAEVTFNTKIYPKFSDGGTGAQAGAEFYVSTTGTITVGTTPLAITQRTYSQIQTSGSGLVRAGNDWRHATTGVLAGSYDRVTVDERGNVTAGSAAETATTFIEGLRLVYDSANGLTVEEGGAYVPGEGDIVDLSLDESLTGLVLTASTFYYLYLYSDAGEGAIEYSTQRPASPYRGQARVKGGPDNVDPDVAPDDTRRLVGIIRGSSTANTMVPFAHRGERIIYAADPTVLYTSGGLKIMNLGGAGTTYAIRDMSPLVPPTSRLARIDVQTNNSSGFEINLDETNATARNWVVARITGASAPDVKLTSSQGFYGRNTVSAGSTDIAVLGYLMER